MWRVGCMLATFPSYQYTGLTAWMCVCVCITYGWQMAPVALLLTTIKTFFTGTEGETFEVKCWLDTFEMRLEENNMMRWDKMRGVLMREMRSSSHRMVPISLHCRGEWHAINWHFDCVFRSHCAFIVYFHLILSYERSSNKIRCGVFKWFEIWTSNADGIYLIIRFDENAY